MREPEERMLELPGTGDKGAGTIPTTGRTYREVTSMDRCIERTAERLVPVRELTARRWEGARTRTPGG